MQPQTRTKNRGSRHSRTFSAAGILIIVFLLYWLFVIHAFPTWQERGLFGDAFGALNALASSLALIGVVYALYLQQKQLHEMRRATELQQQPVLLIDVGEFKIDPPEVFHGTPDEPPCCALSRYHCEISLSNVSDIPAVNAVMSADLSCKRDAAEETLSSVGSHCAIIAPHGKHAESIMLVPNEPYTTLFAVLRNRDALSLPCVSVTLTYRNLLGACFGIRMAYHVLPSAKVEAKLKSWHATISSFPTQHQEELKAFATGEGEHALFDRLRNELRQTLGVGESLSLQLVPIPGAFDIQTITEEAYCKHRSAVRLPRLTFADTECPMTKVPSRSGVKS